MRKWPHDLLSVDMHFLDRVVVDPSVSSQMLMRKVGISQSKVMNVLYKFTFVSPIPFHIGTRITSVRLRIACSILPLAVGDTYYRSPYRKIDILDIWITLHSECRVILCNWHRYSQRNLFITRYSSFQTRLILNAWLLLADHYMISLHAY